MQTGSGCRHPNPDPSQNQQEPEGTQPQTPSKERPGPDEVSPAPGQGSAPQSHMGQHEEQERTRTPERGKSSARRLIRPHARQGKGKTRTGSCSEAKRPTRTSKETRPQALSVPHETRDVTTQLWNQRGLRLLDLPPLFLVTITKLP